MPSRPTAKQYEDLVSAYYRGKGYFTETRIELRTGSATILELDLVATPTGDDFENRLLVEAKSGGWGLGDLFKVYGWRTYLGISSAHLMYRESADKHKKQAIKKVGRATGVECKHFTIRGDGENDDDEDVASCNNIDKSLLTKVSIAAWFQQIAERLAYARFLQKAKSMRSELLALARNYHEATRASFFEKTALERVRRLYRAYQAAPNLTGQFVEEEANKKGLSEKDIWYALQDTNDYLWLQYISLLEHKARSAVIKNALDHALGSRSMRPSTRRIGNFAIDWGELLERTMPDRFLEGMEQLKNHPYGTRIPYLLQIFVELFGGFYANDSDDIEMMSEISGIPADDVIGCLDLYDDFFRFDRSWFFDSKGLTRLKMVPGFIRGAGCFLRQDLYDLDDYTGYSKKMGWVLAKWHNALYHTLENELSVED